MAETTPEDTTEGKPMTEIIDELTAQGIRSVRDNRLSINSLSHILHNDRYLGTYRYADVVIEDGMPQLVDQETFDKVQRRFKENQRMGPHGPAASRTTSLATGSPESSAAASASFVYDQSLGSEFAYRADRGTRPRRVELGFNRYQFALRIWME